MQKTHSKPVYYVSFEAIKNRFIYLPGDEKFYQVSIKYDCILIYDPNRGKEMKINPQILGVIQRLKPFKKHLLGYLIQNFLHSKK